MAGYLGMLASMSGSQKIMDGGGAGPSVFRIDLGLFLGKKATPGRSFCEGGWVRKSSGKSGPCGSKYRRAAVEAGVIFQDPYGGTANLVVLFRGP